MRRGQAGKAAELDLCLPPARRKKLSRIAALCDLPAVLFAAVFRGGCAGRDIVNPCASLGRSHRHVHNLIGEKKQ
jgi:hypothetical protein